MTQVDKLLRVDPKLRWTELWTTAAADELARQRDRLEAEADPALIDTLTNAMRDDAQVYAKLTPEAQQRTSAENVRDVIDALARMINETPYPKRGTA